MSLHGRRANVAEEQFLAPLRRAVTCVTHDILIRVPSAFERELRVVELSQNPTTLSGPRSLSLKFHLAYTLQPGEPGEWHAETAGYRYELHDQEGQEFIAYHWHPFGNSPIAMPHLHVIARLSGFDLSKAHLPTGIVPPVAVIRCLITEFGVAPLRPDWEDILREA